MEDAIHSELVSIHLKFQVLEDSYRNHLKETQRLLEETQKRLQEVNQILGNRDLLSKAQIESLIRNKATLMVRIRNYQKLVNSTRYRKVNLAAEKERLLNVFFEKHRRSFVRENSLQRMVSSLSLSF